jgi:signal transduction histidine kinase
VALLIREARSITGKDLSRRLPVPQAEDEMRRLALEWNDLLARIDEAVGRVTQFTADASHKLRNPIAYIRTTAEFNLNTPSLSEEARQGFQEILDETKSTSELLENLLTLARADAGYAPADVEEVAVDLVIEEVCTRMLPSATARQHHLIWRSESASSPKIRINLLHFRRLCTILLDNAIKYTPVGGTVKIAYQFHDGLNLCISDTGVGIAPEHLPRIFDRFYRVDAARTEVNQGVGLGLPIARWLVELYGGDIRIESRPNHGTAVLVHLPPDATG